MPGMDEDAGIVRYKAVDDMSDSDEAEMDVSDDEDDEDQQPRKKLARTENKAADGDSVPKWSNPDPYTALPPPDESQRKKKDVVKLIRKARVTAATENTVKPATTDDFISFDDLGDDQEMANSFNSADEVGYGVPGAPTGPRGQQAQAPNNFRENGYPQSKAEEPVESNSRGPTTSKIQIELPNRPHANLPKKPTAVIDLTSDPSLGNRKRNIRDEIKGPPMIHGPSGQRAPSDGKIVASWRAKAGRPSTPWIEMDHSQTSNMGLWYVQPSFVVDLSLFYDRLHKEIVDFYYYVKPREFEQRIRQNLIDDLRVQVRKHFPDCNVKSFGSFPAGLYLPTADMDIVCVSNEFLHRGRKVLCQTRTQMYKLGRFLENAKVAMPGTVEVVGGAKVPIIKYVDKLTGLRVDISFENDTGLIANETFQDWKAEFPAMPMLVTLIKHLLAMRGLNEPVNGGIGGFSTICLVVSLLQNMPQVQSRNMIPEHHLGEILMEFFDLYGNQFNTSTTAISMKPPGYVPKVRPDIQIAFTSFADLEQNQVAGVTYKGRMDKISIIDPNKSTNDISAGSQNTPRILEFFSKAHRDLQKRMGELQASPNRAKESILGCILAGNYSSFDLQRQHLAHVHEKLVGPILESR
jgi:non-canonical poly(A) RNA polymerase PAPD5/7